MTARTDRMLGHLARGEYGELRQFFPPDAEIDLARQLERLFGRPPGTLKLHGWDARAIAVERLPGSGRVRTGVRVTIETTGDQLRDEVFLFLWVPESDGTYYLVPREADATSVDAVPSRSASAP